jgi:hypothetical protein
MSDDWKFQFREYFIGAKMSDVEIEPAMQLKALHIPRALYKYRPVSDFSLSNLANDTMWVSFAADFNDPYDSSFAVMPRSILSAWGRKNIREHIRGSNLRDFFSDQEIESLEGDQDTLASFIRMYLSKRAAASDDPKAAQLSSAIARVVEAQAVEPFSALAAAMREAMQVCCFSETHESILMWSHYAKDHRGFCIEYDFAAVDKGYTRLLMPVYYQDEIFDATAYHLVAAERDVFNNFFGLLAAIHKASFWAYEREWRLLFPLPRTHPIGNHPMPKPTHVYLGSRISSIDESRIRAICNSKGIALSRMNLSESHFALSSVPP